MVDYNEISAIATAVAAVFTAVSAMATAAQAKAAKDTLKEIKDIHDEEQAPNVLIYPELAGDGDVDLVVRNIGRTPALKVHAVFDPPIVETSPMRRLLRIALTNDGIPVVVSDEVLRYPCLSSLTQLHTGPQGSTEYVVTWSWEDNNGHKQVHRLPFDFRKMNSLLFPKYVKNRDERDTD